MCTHCLDNHLASLSNSKVLPHNNRIVIRLGLDIGNDERGGLLKRMSSHIVTLQNVPIVTARDTLKSTILNHSAHPEPPYSECDLNSYETTP